MSKQHDRTAVLERQNTVASMYLQRKSQMEIARVVGIDRGTVARDLIAIRRRWQDSALQAISQRQEEELARIDRLETVAWQQFERSCQDAEVHKARLVHGRVSKDGDPLPDLATTEKVARGQAGDPRFLERIAWCIQKRCEILGILTPGQLSVTNVHEQVLICIPDNGRDPKLIEQRLVEEPP
jgi:hypothetical protein